MRAKDLLCCGLYDIYIYIFSGGTVDLLPASTSEALNPAVSLLYFIFLAFEGYQLWLSSGITMLGLATLCRVLPLLDCFLVLWHYANHC